MKVQLKVEKVFIIIAIFFGIIYGIITPPFQSVDEANHFFRSYAISEGLFIAENNNNNIGSYLPESLSKLNQNYSYLIKNITQKTSVDQLKKSLKIKTNKTKKFIHYPNTALYSPIAYIPQSIGIIIGKILHTPPLIALYLARFLNLILYTILGYYAIKHIPFLKIATFLLLLSPMNLSLGCSCSTDATLIGISILLTAKIFEYAFDKTESLTYKDYFLLSILLFILALTKHNFYLIPLLFLIPKEKFKNKYLIKITSIILPSIIGCIIWSDMIKDLYVPLNSNANMYSQADFIIHNPIKYIWILTITTIVKFFRLLITSIGVLGWQDTKLDNLTYIIYPILISISIIYSGIKNFIIHNYQKYIIIITAITGYVIISTYLYLAWSNVGSLIITGLNGKYYTPLLIPIFAVIAALIKYKKDENNKIFNISAISITLILFSGAISILTRFYDIFPNLYYQI